MSSLLRSIFSRLLRFPIPSSNPVDLKAGNQTPPPTPDDDDKRIGTLAQGLFTFNLSLAPTLVAGATEAAADHDTPLYAAYLSLMLLLLNMGIGLVHSIMVKWSPAMRWVQRKLINFSVFFFVITYFVDLYHARMPPVVMYGTVSVLVVLAIVVIFISFGKRNHILVNSNDMTSSDKKEFVWDEKLTELYVKICSHEVHAGNRPTTHLNKQGWANVHEKFNRLGEKNLNIKQLKNKWDNLKKEWQTWKRLVENEIGLKWNVEKKTIEASDEWWDMKLLEIPAAAKFRDKGLQMPDEMELLFGHVVVTRQQAQRSTNTEIEACIEVLNFLNVSENPDFFYDCIYILSNEKDTRRFLLCLKDSETQLGFLKKIVVEKKKEAY